MNRLRYIIAFTSNIEEMKNFYRDRVGLRVESETPGVVLFERENDGAGLMLLAVQPGQARGVELCLESAGIERDVQALRERGVEFAGGILDRHFGKVAHFNDPEGSQLSILEPRPGTPGAAAQEGRSRFRSGGASETTAVEVGSDLALSTVIVNCRDMAAAKAFYRDRLGFHVKTDSPWWVEFDAGATALALHPRTDGSGAERHHMQPVTIGFHVRDLIAWADEARARGVHFTTAPIDEGFGLFADAEDPEGNTIGFREPPPAPGIEEQLAEAFEDDGAPQHVAIRKSVKKGAKAVSRLAVKPEYRESTSTKKKPRPKPLKKRSVRVSSTRGAGPEGARLKPKRTSDPKRARNRPAVGRLKKAERRTLTRKKRAVARASKSRPIKGAMAGGRRR